MTKENTATNYIPLTRTIERKIGRTTFIVSSKFSDGAEKDIVSTVARLVEQENLRKAA